MAIWDIRTRERLNVLSHESQVFNAEFSPNGQLILTSLMDGTVKLWDIETNNIIVDFKVHDDYVYSAKFSPNGQQILTASEDETVKIWDTRSEASLMSLLGHSDGVFEAAYSLDSKKIVSVSRDSIGKLWDAQTGDLIANLEHHKDYVNGVAFSPDGKYFATHSFDESIVLWDIETGKKLKVLEDHSNIITGASFSPNEELIATCSLDGTVRLWNLDDIKENEKELKNLKIGLIRYKDKDTVEATYESIFDGFENRIAGYKDSYISIIEPENVHQLTEGLEEGSIDIGIFTLSTYLDATEENPFLSALATHQVNGKSFYEGYFVVRKNSDIQNLGAFKDNTRHFSFVKETSTSGHKNSKTNNSNSSKRHN